MFRTSCIFAISLFAVVLALSHVDRIAQAKTTGIGHLRLIDRLDRPQDGYCLDVLGTGRALRLELPIFAHNCKPGLTPDSAVEITTVGEIRFADIDLCATSFGVNGRTLAGSPIILRTCGDTAPFFDSAPLQRFEWTDENRLRLKGTTLCLSVGDESASTYSTADRWRVLTVESCSSVSPERAAWEFVRID